MVRKYETFWQKNLVNLRVAQQTEGKTDRVLWLWKIPVGATCALDSYQPKTESILPLLFIDVRTSQVKSLVAGSCIFNQGGVARVGITV